MRTELKDTPRTFIEHATDKGVDGATIRQLLLSAGWKERDVSEALAAQTLDIPVPKTPHSGAAREVFFHVLNFGALYTLLITIVMPFFTYLDIHFPDPAGGPMKIQDS